jgi:DNA-binding MarR family transcriptional regulator
VADDLVQRGPFLLHFANSQQLSALLATALAGAPLTPDEFAVYSWLRIVGPTTPTRLAAALGMRASTMSHYLRRMASAGHLDRSRNPDDGRSSVVALTDSGVEATVACFAGFQTAMEAFQAHLGIAVPELLAAMESMHAALGQANADLAGGS